MKKLVLILIAVPLLTSLAFAAYIVFASSQPYSVTREIQIRRSAKDVFAALSDLRRQSEFNYYNLRFPQLSFSATEPVAGRKQVAEWGFEQLRITAEADQFVPDREISFKLDIDYGLAFPLTLLCSIAEEKPALSRLTCRLRGDLKLHERYIMPSFIAGSNETDPFSDTLLNLKLLLEK